MEWRKEVIEFALDHETRLHMDEQLAWIAREPQNPRPYYNLAQLYRMQWKQEEGLGLLLESVRLDDTYAPAHAALAEIYVDAPRPCGRMAACASGRAQWGRRGSGNADTPRRGGVVLCLGQKASVASASTAGGVMPYLSPFVRRFRRIVLRVSLIAAPATVRERRMIGIGAAVTRRPLPHRRTYGSVYGGSRMPSFRTPPSGLRISTRPTRFGS